MGWGERRERIRDEPCVERTVEVAVGRHRGERGVADLGRAGSACAVRVERDVPRDREEPRARWFGVERLRVLPCAQQRLLDDVLGPSVITAAQPVRIGEESGGVRVVQCAQRVGLQPAGPHTGHHVAREPPVHRGVPVAVRCAVVGR